MRNLIMLFSFLALVLIAAGCQPGSGGAKGPSASDAFIGGTSAIKLSFVENSPPSEVTDMELGSDGKLKAGSGFPFEATTTVENTGEYNIPADGLSVKVSGFYPPDFGVNDAGADCSISVLCSANAKLFRGIAKDPDGNKIRGDLEQFTFPDTSSKFKYNSVLAGNQQFPFRAEVCYKYQTRALSQMCLLDDFTKNNPGVCSPTGSKSVSNSASPIHVTSVAQSVAGKKKLLLSFEVKKVGTSDLFKSDATDRCKDSFSNKDRIGVHVIPGVAGLDCFGILGKANIGQDVSGEVVLSDGSASFTCILNLESAANIVDSVKTFEVQLDYYARDSVTKTVLVKHLI